MDLEISKAPKLNEAAVLTATIVSGYDLDAEAWIQLPTGAVYVDGDLYWNGPLEANVPVQFSSTIAFVEEGKWLVAAYGVAYFSESSHPMDHQYLNIDVGRTSSRLMDVGGSIRKWPQAGIPSDEWLLAFSSVTRDTSQLLNNTSEPIYKVIYDEAGLEELLNQGLVPSVPEFVIEPEMLHTDLDAAFFIAIYDKARPTTGYRVIIDNITLSDTTVKIFVTAEAPHPDTAKSSCQVSPYDIVVANKSELPKAQPIEFRFIVNGELAAQQAAVVRNAFEGVPEPTLSDEQMNRIAGAYLAQRYDIPISRLQVTEDLGYDDLHFWGQSLRKIRVQDTETGASYTVTHDCYGRIVDGWHKVFNAAASGAKYYGRIEPVLYKSLSMGDPDRLFVVRVWLRGTVPGNSWVEAQQPLASEMRGLGYKVAVDEDAPFVTAQLPVSLILELAERDEIALISTGR